MFYLGLLLYTNKLHADKCQGTDSSPRKMTEFMEY